MEKVGRNDLCPCGSGKKFKKCCLVQDVPAGYTREDRITAFAALEAFVDRFFEAEDEAAYDAFWGKQLGREDELGPDLLTQSTDTFDQWFAFDRVADDGRRVIDLFLERNKTVSAGAQRFLAALRDSSMRLYEIVDLSPGVSISFRDVLEKTEVTVAERSASRTAQRHELLAARIVPCGPSGKPEIEAGVLHIPRLLRDSVIKQLSAMRDDFQRESGVGAELNEFYKELPPFFHSAWASSILDPQLPELQNTDGESLIITRVTFDVLNAEAAVSALNGGPELERQDAACWSWSGKNVRGESVSLGRIEHSEAKLTLEANSLRRGERGRAMIEGLAGAAVRHRATTHEDPARQVLDKLRTDRLKGAPEAPAGGGLGLPPEVTEALTLNHLARHYRGWVDEPVPALDGQTPRAAAKDAEQRPKLIQLIHDLEGMYEGALKQGEPAYDPSWMWSSLGLEDRAAARHPPPLAHERVAERNPGFAELGHAVAEQLRRASDFKDASTVLSEEAFRANLDVQRFLRRQESAASALEVYLRLLINFDLHRRKCFWVDEALSAMLEETELDVVGRELRVPFPSFAVVFTDRHFLSLAERLLAAEKACPLAGQILRVATLYVTEERDGDDRTLQISFAFDALGADLPFVSRHAIRLGEELPVESYLEQVAPRLTAIEPGVPDTHPLRGLLRTTINAILYATSAGIEPQLRGPEKASTRRAGAPVSFSSEAVYFLPGAIEISQLRQLQELGRSPDGRDILRRFMVRGHWRRPNASWAEQRMRWVRPYWKGPDMATIIERTYKLKP